MTNALIPFQNQPEKNKIASPLNDSVSLLADIAPSTYNMSGFLASVALQFVKEPKLWNCKPDTTIKALMRCVKLGLDMGTDCNLVAYKDETTLMVEFQGWMRKFSQLQGFKRCVTDVVYAQDEFDYDPINAEIHHKPNLKERGGEVVFAYCVLFRDDCDPLFEVLDRDDINRHRKSARDGGNTPAWNNNFVEMARKSAVQAFNARYGSQLGMQDVADADADAAITEYQNTGPDPNEVEAAMVNLTGRSAATVEAPMVSESLNSSEKRDRLIFQIQDMIIDFELSKERVAEIILETTGDPIKLGELSYLALSDVAKAMRQGHYGPAPSQGKPALSPDFRPEDEVPQLDETALDYSQLALQLRPRLETWARGKRLGEKQVSELVKECGGGDVPLGELMNYDVLCAIRDKFVTWGYEDKQSELELS